MCEALEDDLMPPASEEKVFYDVVDDEACLHSVLTTVKVFTYVMKQAFQEYTAKLDFFHFSG